MPAVGKSSPLDGFVLLITTGKMNMHIAEMALMPQQNYVILIIIHTEIFIHVDKSLPAISFHI